MTDIVERLRSLNDGNRWPMMDEAADEIERLRVECKELVDSHIEYEKRIAEVMADNILLRRALEPKP